MSIKVNLSGVLAGAGLLAMLNGASVHATQPKGASGLEATVIAQDRQEAKPKEFDLLWKEKDDRYTALLIADGIILSHQVAAGDPNYKVLLVYIGKVGKDNLLSEWEVDAVVESVSEGRTDSHLLRTGRVNPDGRFVFDDANAKVVGKAYALAMNALTSSVLATVQNGTPDLVKYWVADTTKKYEALKSGK